MCSSDLFDIVNLDGPGGGGETVLGGVGGEELVAGEGLGGVVGPEALLAGAFLGEDAAKVALVGAAVELGVGVKGFAPVARLGKAETVVGAENWGKVHDAVCLSRCFLGMQAPLGSPRCSSLL